MSATREVVAQDDHGLRALLLSFLLILFITVVAVPIIANRLAGGDVAPHVLAISTAEQILVLGGVSAYLLRRSHVPVKWRAAPRSGWSVVRLTALTVYTFAVARVLGDVVTWLEVGFTNNPGLVQVPTSMTVAELVVSIVLLGAVPAVFEELYYRMTVCWLLAARHRPGMVILVGAVLFAIAHVTGGPSAVPGALVLGVVLMAEYVRERNIAVVVAVHFLYNVLSLVFSNVIVWPTDPVHVSTQASSAGDCLERGLVYLAGVLLLCAIPLLWRGTRGQRAPAW